ncbi:MAG TPA: class I SAM-dependent RNA methyltransferase, partial [Bdellovibrionales bacterium]|nr:class I SAM-dependent RNA methyltransferase [Bdellovibrionales bacterium]
VGRHEGIVVFVPFTAPGDTVRARITEIKKNFARAELDDIIVRGPSRRKAPCPYYGDCGGCNWQHVEYAEQLRQKEAAVRHLIGRNHPEALIEPIIASPSEWRYRRRVQLHTEAGKAGFLKRASHQIIDIKDCIITQEMVTARFDGLRLAATSRRRKFEVGCDDNGAPYELDLEREPYVFMQVNPLQNQNMITRVIDEVREAKTDRIFDLYCGAGNFTIPLAREFPRTQVLGIEANPTSSQLGREKARPFKSLSIETGDTADFLARQTSLSDATVVMDPPRAGVEDKVLTLLKRLRPKRIIYVSCHPATAARDWMRLSPEYKLMRVQPLDMFPQTDHIELISVLTDPARLD